MYFFLSPPQIIYNSNWSKQRRLGKKKKFEYCQIRKLLSFWANGHKKIINNINWSKQRRLRNNKKKKKKKKQNKEKQEEEEEENNNQCQVDRVQHFTFQHKTIDKAMGKNEGSPTFPRLHMIHWTETETETRAVVEPNAPTVKIK